MLSDPRPDEIYPRDGEAWIEEVFRPLVKEFNDHYGNAVYAGPIVDAIVSEDARVEADLYQDPTTASTTCWWSTPPTRRPRPGC